MSEQKVQITVDLTDEHLKKLNDIYNNLGRCHGIRNSGEIFENQSGEVKSNRRIGHRVQVRPLTKYERLSHLSAPIRYAGTINSHDIQCIVCFKRMKIGELYRQLKCFHIFHAKCLDKWFCFTDEMTCPVCRHNHQSDPTINRVFKPIADLP